MNSTSILAIAALLVLLLLTSFDNVSFLSNATSKLNAGKRKKALLIGITISLLLAILMLWAVTQFTFFNNELFAVGDFSITPRFLLLFLGGIFIFSNSLVLLINLLRNKPNFSFQFSQKETVIQSGTQIALFNFAFSLDTILIALALVGNLTNAFELIIIAMAIYGSLMLFFADELSNLLLKSKLLRIVGYAIVALFAVLLISYSLGFGTFTLFSN